jgi:hypothetical protein
MTIHDFLAAERLRLAWAALPASKREAVRPILDIAHEQLKTFVQTGRATHQPHVPHQFMLAKTVLSHDEDGLLPKLPAPKPSTLPAAEPGVVEIDVSPGGEIFGTGKYQQLDPGWIEAAGLWLEHLIIGKHSFPSSLPNVLQIPDNTTLALAGDWGTGPFGTPPGPSIKVAGVIAGLKPDFTIHLGDVYYAGTGEQETDNFVSIWPNGSLGSLALNSNHEMYSGGGPYFKAVSGGNFSLQAPFSFFALENTNWIVIGLDSAYFANELEAYINGSIGDGGQLAFLRQVATKAATERKKVIVLTHHNGLEEDGSAPTALWNEVMAAFPAGTAPAYWYWGHVHAGVVYVQQRNGVRCRCAGHGALPWGFASELANNPNVTWFESKKDGDDPDNLRVLNGCVFLELKGESVTETFFDENGNRAWTPPQAAPAS